MADGFSLFVIKIVQSHGTDRYRRNYCIEVNQVFNSLDDWLRSVRKNLHVNQEFGAALPGTVGVLGLGSILLAHPNLPQMARYFVHPSSFSIESMTFLVGCCRIVQSKL